VSCPQDKSNIAERLNIEQNIKIYKDYIKWSCAEISLAEYITHLLDKLNLERFKTYKYNELSGGMQRRLSLLLTLIQTPRVLILDEVTANVDPSLKHEIWEVI